MSSTWISLWVGGQIKGQDQRTAGSLGDVRSAASPPSSPPRPPNLPLAAAAGAARQAAHLCKADLATSMVTEMTALAGTMGRHYAQREGLPQGE